jgi:hypothetical protein
MKKLFFFALASIVIYGCKKNSNEPKPVQLPPVAVAYAFSSNQIDTYTIRYTDSNKTASTEIITGKNWSKSMKIAASSIPLNLTLYVESSNKSFDASGNLTVAVQGHDMTSMPLNSYATYTYGLRGQIIYSLTDF